MTLVCLGDIESESAVFSVVTFLANLHKNITFNRKMLISRVF